MLACGRRTAALNLEAVAKVPHSFLADGTIVELPHLGSHQVMDVYKDLLLVNSSSLTSPNQILLVHVPGKGQEGNAVMKEVGTFVCLLKNIFFLCSSVFT